MATKKILGAMASAIIILAATMACINTSPSECIQAAEEAGLPDEIIKHLKDPGDLNPAERFALNRALSKAGLADVCREVYEKQDRELTDNTELTEDPERPTTTQLSARIPQDDEHRRRCRFWALNNLRPIVFQEFARLNPDNMDDLDRILWRSILHPHGHLGFYDNDDAHGDDIPSLQPKNPGIYCRDYWAEPLGSGNADLRNHGFETQCRRRLEEKIIGRYSQLADAVNYEKDNDLVYETANQYVRVLQWLDMSGDELMESDSPPYVILQEQSRHPYAHIGGRVPNENFMADYRREWDSKMNLDWLGIVSAAGMSDKSSGHMECLLYYPQAFYGYWVPFDPDSAPDHGDKKKLAPAVVMPTAAPDYGDERKLAPTVAMATGTTVHAVPDYGDEREWDLPEYDSSTTPIFLPETVGTKRVRAGYPLGKTGERYHRCSGESEAKEVGYYFVDHPTGAYCEKIR